MPNYRPGRSSRSGGNAGGQAVSFTMHDAQRINRVVGIVERDRRLPSTSSLPRAAGGGGGKVFQIQFTGTWQSNGLKTVRVLAGGEGYIQAVNNIFTIHGTSSTRLGYVASIDGEYHLIGVACG